MRKYAVLLALGLGAWISCGTAFAAPLKLFGVPLQGATRQMLEPALIHAGFSPIHVGDHWWYDSYHVDGQLPGARKLLVGYTASNHFAMAEYIFPSFMNTEEVSRVIHLVEDKYGDPTRQSGNISLGGVSATWDEGDGMIIRVSRGWPSTTTYLQLENVALYQKMKAEMHQQNQQQQAAQAKAHANAF